MKDVIVILLGFYVEYRIYLNRSKMDFWKHIDREWFHKPMSHEDFMKLMSHEDFMKLMRGENK